MPRIPSRAFPTLVLMIFLSPDPLLPQEPGPGSDRWNRAAREWVGLLKEGNFDGAGARVDPRVPGGAMGPEQLRTIWAQLSGQLGPLLSLEPGTVSVQGEYHAVDLPAAFEAQSVVIRIVLTDDLQVSGFFVRPPAPSAYEPPPYVRPESFREVEVVVGSDPWALPGVLTLPRGEGPFPGLVLVHGSGPNDRDETIGGNKPFRDLAWGLASSGIAVLRYDKRTHVHGRSLPAGIGLEDEVLLDALAALDLARKAPEIEADRVFLLGHSLGGMMAPEIARRDGGLAGVAILAAPARPFFQVLRGQLEYLASLEAGPDSPARIQLDSLVAVVRKAEAGELAPDQDLLGAPAGYWRELAEVDPVATARESLVPLIVLQGGRDYQSTSQDLSLWEKGLDGRERATFRHYPSLDHLFAAGEGTATPEDYVSTVRHVDESVIRDLARWILGGGS